MSFRSAAATVLLSAAAALFPSSAQAQNTPHRIRLELVRAPGAEQCPDAQAFRDAVDAAALADPFDPHARARVVVTLTASASIGRGRWELFDESGAKIRERSVTVTGTCRELVQELALTFVVAYETPPAASVACPPPPLPTCDGACFERAVEEAHRRLVAEGKVRGMDGVSAVVMAGGLLSAGFTADPGGGFWLAGEARGRIFSGALEARVLLPSRVVEAPIAYPFQITSISAALVPCARWKVLLGCAFVDFGMLIAGGSVTPVVGAPVIATLGLGPRLAVHVPFTERFAFRAFADLRLAPVASTFNFVNTGTKWESNVVSGLFGLGVTFE